MFEEVKAWLDGLSPAQKKQLLDNLQKFRLLQTLLESKKCLVKDLKTGNLVIQKNHDCVDDFIDVYKNMTMRGVVLVDNRLGKNIVVAAKSK